MSFDIEWFDDPNWAADASRHVILDGPRTEREGVAAQQAWLREHYPKYRKSSQRCRVNAAGRQIDEITLSAPDNSEVSVFFDITDWFGKS